jgi:hypothetical protein
MTGFLKRRLGVARSGNAETTSPSPLQELRELEWIVGYESVLLAAQARADAFIEMKTGFQYGGGLDDAAEMCGLLVGRWSCERLGEAPAIAGEALDPAFGGNAVEKPQQVRPLQVIAPDQLGFGDGIGSRPLRRSSAIAR